MILTPEALASIRTYIKDSVSYGKYQESGTWHRVEISNADILPDGRITVTFMLGAGVTSPILITRMRVYSVNDILVAETEENIQCNAPGEGILYRFRFNVQEVD